MVRLRRSSYLTGSPWLGVLAAGVAGALLGALHGCICKLPRVNDIAIGIALMLFGTGLAFFLGKPLHPADGAAPAVDPARLAGATSRRCAPALQVNPLFLVGIALAVAPGLGVHATRAGA